MELLQIEQAKAEANQRIRKRVKTTMYALLALLFIVIAIFSVMLYNKNQQLNATNIELEKKSNEIADAYNELGQLINIDYDTIQSKEKPTLNVLLKRAKQNTVDISDQLDRFEELSNELKNKKNITKAELIEIAKEYNEIVETVSENDMIERIEVVKDSARAKAQEAEVNTDSIAWQKAKQLNTIESYKSYLNKFDFGKYRKQATKELNRLEKEQQRKKDDEAFRKATKLNTNEAYNDYLETFKHGIHRNEALAAISKLNKATEEADWKAAVQANTVAAFNTFIGKHPESKYKPQAEEKIEILNDEQAWKNATTANTVEAYDNYIAAFKIHTKEAKEKKKSLLEAQAWQKVSSAPDDKKCAEIETYLKKVFANKVKAEKLKKELKCEGDKPENGTAKDIDGNTYRTVKIGDQWWFAENLRTTKYNDGTPIPYVKGEEENDKWSNLSTPAYCWYNGDESNKTKYGALYNYYTVETGKLCPTGWHVPSDDEWKQMEMYLGMSKTDADDIRYRGDPVGKKLKSTNGWINSRYGNNESGFNALPGGYRNADDGSFYNAGKYGFWWSRTPYGSENAWRRYLDYNGGGVYRGTDNRTFGFSVRCLKDN